MRIFQVITLSELGGAQSVVINLANSLCNTNEVTIIAGGNGKMWQLLDKRVRQIRIASLVREVSILKDIKTYLKLISIYRKLKPDIIHLHSSKIGMLGRLAFPTMKIVYTVHGFDSIRVANRKFLPIERLLKTQAKAIVAVSKYDKKNLNLEGITQNVIVVYNGINQIPIDISIKLTFNNTNKTVLCIARINPQKKFDLFLDIAKLLPDINFVWIGNRTLQDNLPENVLCLGEKPLAGQYYALSDLCILPSNYEGLPMSIIEAMSYGKPIVASNVGGISEIVLNDQNGYTVENTAELFAEKISLILQNKDIYTKFANCSKQIFIENHTVDKMVKSYLNIYNK